MDNVEKLLEENLNEKKKLNKKMTILTVIVSIVAVSIITVSIFATVFISKIDVDLLNSTLKTVVEVTTVMRTDERINIETIGNMINNLSELSEDINGLSNAIQDKIGTINLPEGIPNIEESKDFNYWWDGGINGLLPDIGDITIPNPGNGGVSE